MFISVTCTDGACISLMTIKEDKTELHCLQALTEDSLEIAGRNFTLNRLFSS